MQAYMNLKLAPFEQVWNDAKSAPEERKGILDHIRKLKGRITKYVTFDKDGIFADPNWPHLWS